MAGSDARAATRDLWIDVPGMPGVRLPADLTVPPEPAGVVLFAHGSGSSRHSPRNRSVAVRLQRQGFATLLADLLTGDEERDDLVTGALRFDIGLLAERVGGLIAWSRHAPDLPTLPVGLFGASTGAAAALAAGAEYPDQVAAIVSRGGRPDLAGDALPLVRAPALLIVGERDREVLALNQQAAGQLRAPHQLQVVPGATHLFEEPGALPEVAERASAWFDAHLRSTPPESPEPPKA